MSTLKYTIILLIILISKNTFACTMWSQIDSNETIIAKNRDWIPSHKNILKLIIPKNKIEKYKYLALMVVRSNKDRTVSAGINEKGLIVVRSSSPKYKLDKSKSSGNKVLHKILSKYDTVDSVLNNLKILKNSKAFFYLFGDKNKTVLIEVSPLGELNIEEKTNGTFSHTNHYIVKNFLKFNKKNNLSSITRKNRINKLLESKNKHTFKDFIKYCENSQDGPNNSIWRKGNSKSKIRTFASWVVELPKRGSAKLYTKLANSDDKIKIYNSIILDAKFWQKNKYILD